MQIRIMVEKMKQTLHDCRAAVCGRTPYVITQEDVYMKKWGNRGKPIKFLNDM